MSRCFQYHVSQIFWNNPCLLPAKEGDYSAVQAYCEELCLVLCVAVCGIFLVQAVGYSANSSMKELSVKCESCRNIWMSGQWPQKQSLLASAFKRHVFSLLADYYLQARGSIGDRVDPYRVYQCPCTYSDTPFRTLDGGWLVYTGTFLTGIHDLL